jgi:hypothetical protein
MELLENYLFEHLVQKYNLFVRDIQVEIQKNENLSTVLFNPRLTLIQQLCPKEYYSLKKEIYEVVFNETGMKPVVNNGWEVEIINWTNTSVSVA